MKYNKYPSGSDQRNLWLGMDLYFLTNLEVKLMCWSSDHTFGSFEKALQYFLFICKYSEFSKQQQTPSNHLGLTQVPWLPWGFFSPLVRTDWFLHVLNFTRHFSLYCVLLYNHILFWNVSFDFYVIVFLRMQNFSCPIHAICLLYLVPSNTCY